MPQPQDVQLPGKSIYDMLFERYPFVTSEAQQKIKQQPLRIAPLQLPLLGNLSGIKGGSYTPQKGQVRIYRPYNRQEFADDPALLDTLMHEMTHAYDYNWMPSIPSVNPLRMFSGTRSSGYGFAPRAWLDESTRNLARNYGGGEGIDRIAGWRPDEILAQTASVWGPDLLTKTPGWMQPAMSGLYDFSWKPPAQTAVQPASAYPSDYRLGR